MPSPIPFGNYELIERIAEGGMAEVWRARSRGVAGFEKTVVIKRVLPTLLARPGFTELLVREAKIAARLSHPNIIQIFDLGEQDGGYYIAMEYLRGRDLAAALSYRGTEGDLPLTLSLRLWIGSEVAKALDYAHRAKGEDGKPLHIVHRDVSPQNVLLGFEGEVKVADFGIAHADEVGLGRGEDPKVLRGKYAYMSPEQARGEPLDRRSDIFAFGILLYELVTRRRMFRGKSSHETLEAVRRAELPSYRRALPLPGIGAILERALSPKPDDRYASAGEIHAELMRMLFSLGEPVGQTDLADAMHRMFPPVDFVSPNKLRVDLLVRAHDDATAVGEKHSALRAMTEAESAATDTTRALPSSRKMRSEKRRLAFLFLRARPGDERLFEASIESTGGVVMPARGGFLVGAYGLGAMERAVGHATRGALELRRANRLEGRARVERLPSMAVVAGEGTVLEGTLVSAEDEVIERASALLARSESGELRVSGDLRGELAREFKLREISGDLVVENFRARRDRDAVALRTRAPLVGRRESLRTLSGALINVAHGRGEIVHLLGEPGVGKSRLLAELRATAAPTDFVFVQGRADEADTSRPFGALADLVLDVCGIEPEDTPAQRFEKVERLRVLGLVPREVRMMGELIGLAYPVAADVREGRPRGIEIALALRRALRRLATDRVVVLALEDLQWMDDATRQVLPLLLKGLTAARVLVLITRRPGSSGPLVSSGRTIEIGALDPRNTGRLAAHWLGAREAEEDLAMRVHRETGGIPAWIEQLAEPLRPHVIVEDSIVRLAARDLPDLLPASVRSVVAARIERLRPRDRSLLRAAATFMGPVEVRILSAVEGLVGHTERPALRRLLVRRLFVSEETDAAMPERLGAWGGDEEDERLPMRVRVPSELLRRAVLAELDEEEQRRLHARVVATLERIGAADDLEGLEQLARHAARSLDHRRVPDYFVRAAELSLSRGEPARAAAHLLSAAHIVREERGDPSDEEAFELSLRAADAALNGGALEVAELALAPLGTAVDRVDPAAAVRRAIMEARVARRRMVPARAREALSEMQEALGLVDPSLRLEALAALGWALAEEGSSVRALEVLAQVVDESDAPRRGRALAALAAQLARADRVEEADSAVSEALALAARTGEGASRYAALAAMGAVLEAQGDLESAASRYREAAELALSIHEPLDLAALSARSAVAALAGGDDAQAKVRAEECERWARETQQRAWALVASALLVALASREEPDAARIGVIVEAADELEKTLARPGEAAIVVEMLSYAHLALGDLRAARSALEQAASLAERVGFVSQARRLRERARTLSPA